MYIHRYDRPFPDSAAIFSDLHFRVDPYSPTWTAARPVFKKQVAELESRGVEIFLAGDVVDVLGGTTMEDIKGYDEDLYEILVRLFKTNGVSGNHEFDGNKQLDRTLVGLDVPEILIWEDGTAIFHGHQCDPWTDGALEPVGRFLAATALWFDYHGLLKLAGTTRYIRDFPGWEKRVIELCTNLSIQTAFIGHSHKPKVLQPAGFPRVYIGSNGWARKSPPYLFTREESGIVWIETGPSS